MVISHAVRQSRFKNRTQLSTFWLYKLNYKRLFLSLKFFKVVNFTCKACLSFRFSIDFHSKTVGGRVRLTSWATLSQFFLVGQKTKEQCCGAISATRTPIPSGSILRVAADNAGKDRAGIIRSSGFRNLLLLTSRRVSPVFMYSFSFTGRKSWVYTSACEEKNYDIYLTSLNKVLSKDSFSPLENSWARLCYLL